MPWIGEMIAGMRRRKAAQEDAARTEHLGTFKLEIMTKQISRAKDAWADLLFSLKHDVKQFNGDKARTGHAAVLVSGEKSSIESYHFEVYLPEMESKLMVLTMSGNHLEVEVRPEFPTQKATITMEARKGGNEYCWILAGMENDEELTATQLSEYLLRPILSSALID